MEGQQLKRRRLLPPTPAGRGRGLGEGAELMEGKRGIVSGWGCVGVVIKPTVLLIRGVMGWAWPMGTWFLIGGVREVGVVYEHVVILIGGIMGWAWPMGTFDRWSQVGVAYKHIVGVGGVNNV